VEKRSLTLSGHRTSIALESEFWTALEEMATARGLATSALIREIDEKRTEENLSSAVRLAVLRWYRDRARTGSSASPARSSG
jgi:predicted DNA-binding ribbon-helix-helix protein